MCQYTIYDYSLCSSHGLLSLSIHMIDLINLDKKKVIKLYLISMIGWCYIDYLDNINSFIIWPLYAIFKKDISSTSIKVIKRKTGEEKYLFSFWERWRNNFFIEGDLLIFCFLIKKSFYLNYIKIYQFKF